MNRVLSTTAGSLFVAAAVACAGAARADAPTPGGSLSIVMRSSPGKFDCHAAQGYSNLQAIAPAYSTLLMYERGHYPNIVGDVAESWTASQDGKTYTFRLRSGVKFHDGSAMTSKDVAATYERMKTPPKGVTPILESQMSIVDAIEAPDDTTVVFHLKVASPSALYLFAAPTGCIYSAAKLKSDPAYPAQTVLGTGPFAFVSFETGSKITYKKFPDYFRKGRPYLDALSYIIVPRNGLVPAMTSGQVDADFFTLGAPLQQQIKAGRGDRVTFETGPTTVSGYFTVNTKKKPFDDVRVRRALTLALDRPLARANLPKIISVADYKPPIFIAGAPSALSDAELAPLPGYGTEPARAKEEARKLLKEAGAENLSFELTAIGTADPFETFAIFAIDQWRQIGVKVSKKTVDLAGLLAAMSAGSFDVAIDFNSPMSMDPDEVLAKHIPRSPSNYTGSGDATLNKLADEIAAELDPARRIVLTKQFETRLLDQAYAMPMLWATRTVAYPSNLMGWTMPPNFSLWLDMADIWLKH